MEGLAYEAVGVYGSIKTGEIMSNLGHGRYLIGRMTFQKIRRKKRYERSTARSHGVVVEDAPDDSYVVDHPWSILGCDWSHHGGMAFGVALIFIKNDIVLWKRKV